MPFSPRAFGMNPFTLSLSEPQESEFRKDYIEENLPYLRMASVVATLIWAAFGLSELTWAKGELLREVWLIRYGAVLPVLVIGTLSTFVPRWKNAVFPLFMFVFLAVTLGLIEINNVVPSEYSIPTEIGYILLVISGLTFFRHRFIQGVLLMIEVTLVVVIDALLSGTPNNKILYDVILIGSAFLFGGFAGYGMEYYARRNWLLTKLTEKKQQIEMESEKLRTAQKLARTIAHEFNNPLSVIQAVYDLHLEPKLNKDAEREYDDLQRIPRMVKRMSELVRKLLTITHIDDAEYVRGISFLALESEQEASTKKESPAAG